MFWFSFQFGKLYKEMIKKYWKKKNSNTSAIWDELIKKVQP
jgi:hypothetical protein